ncbi:DNA polymerase, partial [Clostridium sporogenes]
MRTLAIDVETYCELDIKSVGAYKYCEHPSFEIMLLAYAYDDEPVKIIDIMNGEKIPEVLEFDIYEHYSKVLKTAFNANFERNAIKAHFKGLKCHPGDWECTMVKALTLGLPSSLDMVGKALNFEEDKQKMKEGKALIQYFCKPCKPTKTNGKRTRNLPEHDMEKWKTFKEYCKRDVEVEREIRKLLNRYETKVEEQKLWQLDQHINDRGVGTDLILIKQAIECDTNYTERLTKAAIKLTGLENPNSPTQIKKWIGERLGREVKSLTKTSIPGLIEEAKSLNKSEVIKMLELRQLMAKTSIKKYDTMQNARCKDGRVRGLLQFYGANRTGRWAGRLVQVQNLPQNHLPDLDNARNFVRGGKFEEVEFLFDSVPDTLSQLIRTAFIPREGNRFIVSDFSAIEARVIAWFAGEQWRLDVFKTHGKIYEASASQMFKVPIENIKKGSELRQKGKIAELALGYG